MTIAVEVPTAVEARELTDRIKIAVDGAWHLIKQAYLSRAWAALGYDSWDDYCTREFGTSRLRLPREERQEVVASFREIGMSTRAIAAATGTSVGTVHAELAGVQNRTPEPDWRAVAVGGGVSYVEAERKRERASRTSGCSSQPDRITGTDGKSYPTRPPTPLRTEYQAPMKAPTCDPVVIREQKITEISVWAAAGSALALGLSGDETVLMLRALNDLSMELRQK